MEAQVQKVLAAAQDDNKKEIKQKESPTSEKLIRLNLDGD